MTVKIRFGYPRRGLQGKFNTFRLGQRLATLAPGEQVDLVDARSERLLKRATVRAVHVGPLNQMAQLHACNAHNWKTYPEETRPSLLMSSLAKRYPPNRVTETSVVTVIDLEVDDEDR